MMDQIRKNGRIRCVFRPFRKNKLISSPETFGWAVVSSYSEEVKEGAVAFLKLRTQLNQEKKEELFSKDPEVYPGGTGLYRGLSE